MQVTPGDANPSIEINLGNSWMFLEHRERYMFRSGKAQENLSIKGGRDETDGTMKRVRALEYLSDFESGKMPIKSDNGLA